MGDISSILELFVLRIAKNFTFSFINELEFTKKNYCQNKYVATLALSSRPRQGFTRLRAKRKPMSEGKCEGMNPHTPKGASTLGVWSPDGLLNFQKGITRVKTQWIEKFFISLKSY